MMNFKKICSGFLENLPGRTQDVILRRFGMEKEKETLESIGKRYGICRERVRQIEEDGMKKIESLKNNQINKKISQNFVHFLKENGNLKREDKLLNSLGGKEFSNHAFFLLTILDPFQRFAETKDLHSLWTINEKSPKIAKEFINIFIREFQKKNQPLYFDEIFQIYQKKISPKISSNKKALISYLEISKYISEGPFGQLGLTNWPEINPKGIKDRAYLAFKQAKKPLSFRDVALIINELKIKQKAKALPQTVHNELIRDPRFILVGRGIYALKEWGYEPGQVKDIILKILKKSKKPLLKEKIVKEVLKQRLVKESTILVSLRNVKDFKKDLKGRYYLSI